MKHAFIKFSAAFLAGSALVALPAYAFSPPSLNGGPSLMTPAADEENEEVMRDMRPDEMPAEEDMKKEEEETPAASEDSGNEENKELWRDLETGVTPPPGD